MALPGTRNSGLERTSKEADGDAVFLSCIIVRETQSLCGSNPFPYHFLDPGDNSAWSCAPVDNDLVSA
jgi:hypothetical protein